MDPLMFGFLGMFGKILGGIQGANAARIDENVANTNAYIAGINREMAQMDRNLAYTTNSLKTSKIARAVRLAQGGATAHFAANNIDPAFGSPLLIQEHAAAQGEADKALTLAQSEMDASNALSHKATASGQQVTALYSAAAARYRAVQSLLSGFIGAGTQFLRASTRWPGLSADYDSTSGTSANSGFDLYYPGYAGIE